VNVVDSSAWLEYFAGGPNSEFFAAPIEKTSELVVPSLCLYEVFKWVLDQRGEDSALQVVAVMQQGTVVTLNASLALNAARISLELRIPMADSIILATARAHSATLWTQDADFEGITSVQFRKQKS